MAATGVSLHIGASEFLDIDRNFRVDRSFEADAERMAEIAQQQNFNVQPLLVGKNATAVAVREGVKKFAAGGARALKSGDLFLLTFSGHGFNRKNLAPNEEFQIINQTWVLHGGGEIFDEELGALLQSFNPGVRIVVFSDSCNSGTIIEPPKLARLRALVHQVVTFRFLRARVLKADEAVRERALVEQQDRRIGVVARLREDGQFPFKAAAASTPFILLLGASQDGQSAQVVQGRGLFTTVVAETWNKGGFSGTHKEFHAQIERAVFQRSGESQTPNLLLSPRMNNPLLTEHPFTIVSPPPAPAAQPANVQPVLQPS